MEEYEHHFKKKFGQNFLKDENIIQKIVRSADIKENSLIIEIGPGEGALTKELVNYGDVLAYEIDHDLEEVLTEKFKNKPVTFLFDDFLKRDIKQDLTLKKQKHLYVIANLPYYITTPIITKLIEENIPIEKMILMVQKEVGDRFSAKVGTKDYSSITVFLNYYFQVKKEFLVSRNNFYPKPNVDSVIVSFTRKEPPEKVLSESHFFGLIRDAFQYKRKNLRNNLKNYDLNKVEEVLKQHGYDLTIRAEQIPLSLFIEISNYLSKN